MELSLNAIKAIIEKLPRGTAGRRLFNDEIKKIIIEFHYRTGTSMRQIGAVLDIHQMQICGWKKRMGAGQTAFIHGRAMRHDVRTKCIAVKEIIEDNLKIETAANIYGVSVQSINTWLSKYREDYAHLVESPDGIPYLIKEKKMVYGRENINKIRALLQGQADQLMCLIDTMHMSGAQAEAMKKCAEATLAREAELTQAAELLSKNGIDIQ